MTAVGVRCVSAGGIPIACGHASDSAGPWPHMARYPGPESGAWRMCDANLCDVPSCAMYPTETLLLHGTCRIWVLGG